MFMPDFRACKESTFFTWYNFFFKIVFPV
jgi:hypothetical protein